MFFTDANSACYHTSQDDVTIVDFDKLDQQVLTSSALAETLVSTDEPPVFDAAAPATSYEDAVSMLGLVTKAEVDLPLLDPEAQQAAQQYIADLQTIVDAGPAAFDEERRVPGSRRCRGRRRRADPGPVQRQRHRVSIIVGRGRYGCTPVWSPPGAGGGW